MKRNALALVLASVTVLGSGSNIPGWFERPPQSSDALYGVGTGESRDLQMAKTMAEEAARTSIARGAESKVSALFKQLREQVNGVSDGEFLQLSTDVSKSVASFVTTATRVNEQKIENVDGGYREFTLMEMPIGEANAAIMERIRAQQNLYTRFRVAGVSGTGTGRRGVREVET